MTILSDRQIRERCEQHAGTVKFGTRAGTSSIEIEQKLYYDNVVSIEDQIARAKSHYPNSSETHLLSMYGHADFEKYKALFAPMIEPFVPRQIREIERNATEAENQIVERFRLSVRGTPEECMVALDNKSITNVRVDPMLGLQIRQRILSKGLTSFGYDVSLSNEFAIFTNEHGGTIDPLNFDETTTLRKVVNDDYVILPPNSYLLGRTNEYFHMPRDVVAVAVGKSTYARCGAIVNVTPIEPGFSGYVVIEISNATSLPLKIYANQGVAQFMFYKGEACDMSYGDRNGGKGGKYQGQTGITLAKG